MTSRPRLASRRSPAADMPPLGKPIFAASSSRSGVSCAKIISVSSLATISPSVGFKFETEKRTARRSAHGETQGALRPPVIAAEAAANSRTRLAEGTKGRFFPPPWSVEERHLLRSERPQWVRSSVPYRREHNFVSQPPTPGFYWVRFSAGDKGSLLSNNAR